MMSTNPDNTGHDDATSSNELARKLTDFSGLNNALREDLKKIEKLANSDSSDTTSKVRDFRKEHGEIITDLEKLTQPKPGSAIAAASGPAAPSTQLVSVSSKRSISVATQTDGGGKSDSQSAVSSANASLPSSVAPSSGRMVSAAASSFGFFGTAAASLSSAQQQVSSATATDVGDEENVLVSCIVSPSLFWLQNEREMEGATTMWSLKTLFDQFYDIDEWNPVEVVTSGVRVMAPFNEPTEYYRAIILRDAGLVTLKARSSAPISVAFVQIAYVDYGNAEFVSKESLYLMPEKLDRMPYLARPARLLGVEPAEASKVWSRDDCERFEAQFGKFATPEDQEDGIIRAVATTLEIDAAEKEKEAFAFPALLDWPKGRQTVSVQLRRSDGRLEPLQKLLLADGFLWFAGDLQNFGFYSSNSPKDAVVMVWPTRFYDWQVAGIAKLDIQQPHGSAFSDRNVVSVERAGDSSGAVNAISVANQPSGNATQHLSGKQRNRIVPPHQPYVPPDSTIKFRVSMVSSPSDFYILPEYSKKGEQMIFNYFYSEMHVTMDSLYNDPAYREPVDITQFSQNSFCAVKVEGHWKRGQVVDTHVNGTQCDVRLLDSARTVTCNVLDIWELRSKFADLPIQAVQCSLSDVAPVDAAGWSNAATERFKDCVKADDAKDDLLKAFVVENVPLKLSVTRGDSEISINELLIREGLAKRA